VVARAAPERKRLTVEFPEELWPQSKKSAIDADEPMRTIVVELIEEWLKKAKGMTER
jgi:hypothetical protein